MLFFHYATFFLLLLVFSDATEHHNYDVDVKKLTSELTGEELTGEYSAYTLDNGLDVVIHSHNNSKLPKLEVSLSVGVGFSGVSKKEPVLKQAIPGLAHLLEHSIFYGSNKFSRPFEIMDFLKTHHGTFTGTTARNLTAYGFQISRPDYFDEALERFAYMFISPIFTTESVKTESTIIHNEWLQSVHMYSKIRVRFPALLMTEGQPSELFNCGNLETLKDITSEQVELFWKTHYTPDNMKLAISVHQDFKDTVHKAVLDYFSLIQPNLSPTPAADNMLDYMPVSFWDQRYVNQYVKVYSPDFRRNELHLYWHFHCDNEAVCRDSLQMTVHTIWALLHDFRKRKVSASYSLKSYNEYILQVTVRVRDKELSSLALLKNQIIDKMKESIPKKKNIDKYLMTFNSSPMNPPEHLSKAMMFGPLTEAPLRAHVDFVYSKNAENLMEKQLNVLLEESPRVIVSYKGTFYKNAMQRNLLLDPYYFIYYEFANDLENEELPQVEEALKPTKSSINVLRQYSILSFPYKFLRGMLIEMILIKLKENKLYHELDLDDSSVLLQVFFEKPAFGEDTMKILIEAFTSLSDPSQELFEKAKKRWLLEYQSITAEMSSGDIAAEYAKLLTSPNLLGETALLISDPYPENVTLEEVKKAGAALPGIGVCVACPFFPENSVGIDDNLVERIEFMWSRAFPPKSDYTSSFAQPASGETFIYCPSPIPTVNSETMIVFSLGESLDFFAPLLRNIFYSVMFKRLRTEMKLTYTPHAGIFSGQYVFIKASSPHTPVDLQKAIGRIIHELPEYIRGYSKLNWDAIVIKSICQFKDQLKLYEIFTSADGIELVINKVRRYLIGNESGRLIIQLWGRDQGPARQEYLDKMRLAPTPSIQLIETINEYPRKK